MIKANVKVTATLINPDDTIVTVVPTEYPDQSYAKSAMLKILFTLKQMGFIDEPALGKMRWVSADSARVAHVDFELETVTLADNMDMAAAVQEVTARANSGNNPPAQGIVLA